VPAPRQLAGGRQREHPGLLCRHEPGWRLGGWGGVASLMWLSPASMYALGPASSAGALTQRRGGVSNLAGMRARVTRQRGPSRPKPGLPGRGQARTVRPPAALRCPEL